MILRRTIGEIVASANARGTAIASRAVCRSGEAAGDLHQEMNGPAEMPCTKSKRGKGAAPRRLRVGKSRSPRAVRALIHRA
jgi:hypothetical protein